MAEDIKEVQKEELPFHPCLTPRGMTWFNLEILTPVQQKLLNDLKVEIIREDNQYLAKHPEIRAIIAVFLHAILREQPKLKSVVDFARDFFLNMQDVKHKIDEYMKERNEPIIRESVSAMNVEIPSPRTSRTTVDEFDILSREDVYTYTSFTTAELSTQIEYEESEYDFNRLYRTLSTISQKSRKSTVKARPQNVDDLLFSSQISLISDHEGYYEEEEVEFDENYALPISPHPTEIDIQAQEGSSRMLTADQEYLQKTMMYGEDYDESYKQDYDYDDEKILKEIKLAHEIHESLSAVINVYEDEEDEGEDNYTIIPEDKKSIIQADLESLKGGTMMFEESEDQFGEQKKASLVLETLLNYEHKKTLSIDGEG